MSVLVTTLNAVLERADRHLEHGRIQLARSSFEELLQLAQERVDRPMEVIARTMLAQCALNRRDQDEAAAILAEVAPHLDQGHTDAYGRYRGVLARLIRARGPAASAQQECLDYLRWSEEQGASAATLDACMLLSESEDAGLRSHWLERGIAAAVRAGGDRRLGAAYNFLAMTQDQLGQREEALESYQQALRWHTDLGSPREIAAATWAVGNLAARLEDYPLARERLEQAIALSQEQSGSGDILALATVDLATVYEAAGDVIEARRLCLRALDLAEQEELASVWPDRMQALLAYAKRLELR